MTIPSDRSRAEQGRSASSCCSAGAALPHGISALVLSPACWPRVLRMASSDGICPPGKSSLERTPGSAVTPDPGSMPAQGYEVIISLRERSVRQLDVPEGTMYLVCAGLSTAAVGLPSGSRPLLIGLGPAWGSDPDVGYFLMASLTFSPAFLRSPFA
jgi:hypothetical protein